MSLLSKDEIRAARRKLCKACPHRVGRTETFAQCALCGCLIQAKTALDAAKCPIDKW